MRILLNNTPHLCAVGIFAIPALGNRGPGEKKIFAQAHRSSETDCQACVSTQFLAATLSFQPGVLLRVLWTQGAGGRGSLTWWQGDDLESCRSLLCSDVNGLEIPGFKWLEGSGLGFQAKRLVLSSVDTLGGTSKIIQSQDVGEMSGACFCQIEMQLQAVWEHMVLMPSVAFF